jgi:hypothetical protein
MRINCLLAVLGLAAASPACAQNSGWEGETGVFITPMAYTAPSTATGFGLPIVGYHYLYGGKVLGDFQEISIAGGGFQRWEFGYTRAFHNQGSVPSLSPLWHNGYNIFHSKFNLLPENASKKAWVPAISIGFILRTQVHDVGAAILDKSVTNGDVYIVATKTITQSKMVPIILSGGVRGTNAELWGMGGNTPNFQERAFGAVGFVFKGPAHTAFILASEFSQQPRHPSELPTAIIPTTITYAIRFVPTPERKINFDFGVAQIAGQIAPGVNLQARAQVAAQVSYGF